MKKIIKSIPVYLTVVMLLCSLLIVPAFATSDGDVIEPYMSYEDCLGSVLAGAEFVEFEGAGYAVYLLPAGTYSVEYGSFVGFNVPGFSPDRIVFKKNMTGSVEQLIRSSNNVFSVTDEMLMTDMEQMELPQLNGFCMIYVNSYGCAPVVRVYNEPVVDNPSMETTTGIYYQAFDMFAGFFYGEGVELTGEQNMVLTILATTAVLFVVVVPFLILFFVLRLFR